MNVLAQRPVRIVVGVLVALVLFGGGFALGDRRAAAPATTERAAASGAAGRGGFGGGAAGAAARGIANGQIIAVNTGSITISLRQGGPNAASPATATQLVLVGNGTRVVKTSETDVRLSDLKVGDTVTVAGTPDATSGTISAQAIVLGGANVLGEILGGTQLPGGRGGAGGSARPSATP